MIRKVTVRQDQLPDIVRSLTMVSIASTTALIEYQTYLDVNLKSPTVHQKLKQVKDNLEYTIRHIQRNFLTIPDEDLTEGINFKCHELMRMVMRMTEPELDGLLSKMKEEQLTNDLNK